MCSNHWVVRLQYLHGGTKDKVSARELFELGGGYQFHLPWGSQHHSSARHEKVAVFHANPPCRHWIIYVLWRGLHSPYKNEGAQLGTSPGFSSQVAALARGAYTQSRLVYQSDAWAAWTWLQWPCNFKPNSNALDMGLPSKHLETAFSAEFSCSNSDGCHSATMLAVHSFLVPIQGVSSALHDLGPGYLKDHLIQYFASCPLKRHPSTRVAALGLHPLSRLLAVVQTHLFHLAIGC